MQVSTITIRTAGPADAPTIAALAIQVFLDTYATDGVRPDLALEALSEYSPQAFTTRLLAEGTTILLAERATGLLGFAEVIASSMPPANCPVVGAELRRLYVQPNVQGHGLGRLLLEAAEQCAMSDSMPGLWLTAWEGNARARAFYRYLGYVQVGHTSYTFQGCNYQNHVMAKQWSRSADGAQPSQES